MIYNPSIAKFLSVDPLAKSYPMLTPYQFASNRPIEGIDLDGLEFYKSTYFDFNLTSAFSLVDQKSVKKLTIKPDLLRMKNGGVIDALMNNTSQLDQKNVLVGIDKSVDLALEFKDLGIPSNGSLGKVLSGIGKTKGAIGIVGEFINAYEQGRSKGTEDGLIIAQSLLNRDIQRAEWVSEVVAAAVNNGILGGDPTYLEQFANFALDGKIPIIDENSITGLGKIDENLVNRFNSDFEKLDGLVKMDKKNFTEISNNSLDRGPSLKFLKIKKRKFKN